MQIPPAVVIAVLCVLVVVVGILAVALALFVPRFERIEAEQRAQAKRLAALEAIRPPPRSERGAAVH